jgi:hypothetical protein
MLNEKLRSASYKGVEERHRRKLIEHETTKMAVSDLDKYYLALDKALLNFHSIKVQEINRIVRELWQLTCVVVVVVVVGRRSSRRRRPFVRSFVARRGRASPSHRGARARPPSPRRRLAASRPPVSRATRRRLPGDARDAAARRVVALLRRARTARLATAAAAAPTRRRDDDGASSVTRSC